MFFTRTSCAVRTGKSGILFSIPLFFLRRVCYNGASIMKKVHSAGFRPVTFVHFCHHTPQGDVGKHNTATAKPSPAPITPRKGTLELSAIANKGFGNGKSHPARGRKRKTNVYIKTMFETNSHPARGRKRRCCILRTNSRPARGRKKLSVHLEEITVRTNSHPARGRKSNVAVELDERSANQLTPRKGTKKKHILYLPPALPRNQLTPRKGTNKQKELFCTA